MDRPLPTDPPDEPVNRIAWAMEPKASKAVPSLQGLDQAKAEGFSALLTLYKADPEGEHREELLAMAKKQFGGVETALMFFNMLSKTLDGIPHESVNIANKNAKIIQRIARELQRLLEG
jgi:hypothetical protein